MNNHERRAFLYASIVAMGGFLFGLDAALISGTIKFISSEFALTEMQLGTVVSAPGLGVLIALPFAGWMSNLHGRKRALQIVALLYLISAVGSAFAPGFWSLVAARFLGGLAFSSISLASMYIGEVAPPLWRGRLVTVTQINIVVGLSSAYFVNYLLLQLSSSGHPWVATLGIDVYTWRWMLGTEILPDLVWLGLLWIIPESPYWLTYRSRFDEAREILRRLMPVEKVAAHLDEMRESLAELPARRGLIKPMAEILGRSMRRTCIIAFTIAIAQQATGINAILFYAPTVFEQVGVGENAAFVQAIWIGLTSVVFTVAGLLLVDRLGRRPLILGGMVWIVVSLGVCGYGFANARYVVSEAGVAAIEDAGAREALSGLVGSEFGSDIAFKRALAQAMGEEQAREMSGSLLQKFAIMNSGLLLAGILSFIAAFHFSVGPVMWVLFSEIFPISVRGIAIPFYTLVTSFTSYLVQQFFPWQLMHMGAASIFFGYAAAVGVGMLIMYFTLIETKNLSIEEIQKLLARGH